MTTIRLAALAATTLLATPVLAQMTETGAGNPNLTCTQFLDLEEAAQADAVATLMIVGSDSMPDTEVATDSGATGNGDGSDAAQAADAQTDDQTGDQMTATEDMPEVSPDMVRAMANICANSVEPS